MQPGDWVVEYRYDGLGRLACKRAPMPNSDPEDTPRATLIEFYAFDGTRRIVDEVHRPVLVFGGSGSGGSGGGGSGGSGGGGGGVNSTTDREYVWSPSGGGSAAELIGEDVGSRAIDPDARIDQEFELVHR